MKKSEVEGNMLWCVGGWGWDENELFWKEDEWFEMPFERIEDWDKDELFISWTGLKVGVEGSILSPNPKVAWTGEVWLKESPNWVQELKLEVGSEVELWEFSRDWLEGNWFWLTRGT